MQNIETKAPQIAIQKLAKARNVLAGVDFAGNHTHPSQFSEGVISFADGEGMRRPFPTTICSGVEALCETQISSLEKYFFGKRYNELDLSIEKQFTNEGISPEIANNICVSTGTSHLFNAFFNSLNLSSDTILTAPGYYHSLANWCDLNGGILETLNTKKENNYKITVNDIEYWLNNNASKTPKALVLFNPTYTGEIYNKDEIDNLATYLANQDMYIIEDSLFWDTIFSNQKATHLASNKKIEKQVITLNGVSKAYGLANMRIGWACGPKWLIDKMNFYVSATQVDAPHISKVMANHSLNASPTYLEDNIKELEKRVDLIVESIDKINMTLKNLFGHNVKDNFLEIVYKPKAGHSLLVSFNNLKGLITPDHSIPLNDSINITKYFLDKIKVAFSPGLSMGFSDCTLRISYGCVGLEATYESSIKAEKVLMENMISDKKKVYTDQVLDEYRNEQEKAFKYGRNKIVDGLTIRLLPELIRILEYNYYGRIDDN